MVQKKTIALIVVLVIILILIAVVIWIWIVKRKPKPPIDCTKSGWAWDPSCLFFKENYPDPSIIKPDNQVYLVGFKRSDEDAIGPPICIPMFYRFRFVNVITGGYGPLSKWTQSPVVSGGTNFPCVDEKCPSSVGEGKQSCNYNHPVVGVKDLHYNPNKPNNEGDFIWANIHRFDGTPDQTSPPPDSEEGKIVGYLYPTAGYPDIKYIWNDIFFNPCTNNNEPICLNRCAGC